MRKMTRREWLRMTALTSASVAVAACTAPPASTTTSTSPAGNRRHSVAAEPPAGALVGTGRIGQRSQRAGSIVLEVPTRGTPAAESGQEVERPANSQVR